MESLIRELLCNWVYNLNGENSNAVTNNTSKVCKSLMNLIYDLRISSSFFPVRTDGFLLTFPVPTPGLRVSAF